MVILVVVIGLGENISKQNIFVVRFNRQEDSQLGVPTDWDNGD